MVVRKDELETQLKSEQQLIREGTLRDDSPLDSSEEFQNLCIACRAGDLKTCQEAIDSGVNINARDLFDYTPLILASLCGHFDVVRLLLESGALCERDTFQGERCVYNALTDRIRNLLLQYDYSKSTDPLQPLASHITSLRTRQAPKSSDIVLTAGSKSWNLHKFVLSARSPYFQSKLSTAPETKVWRLANTIPPEAFEITIRFLYLGGVPSDLGLGNNSRVYEEEFFRGIDKISKQLEINSLWNSILAGDDRRIARQRHQDEVTRGKDQLEAWYRANVLGYKVRVETSRAKDVKWTKENGIFADVLLRADEADEADIANEETNVLFSDGIPVGPSVAERSLPRSRNPVYSVLFPAHRAMLVRSDYFQKMFSGPFIESQESEYLRIVKVDCRPETLKIILDFLYTETTVIPINLALDVLYAAEMLFIDKLKIKAALVISTIGNGPSSLLDPTHIEGEEVEVEQINVYDVLRAAWDLKVQRLEEFCARYFAYRLEDYIDEGDFEEMIKESAGRIQKRQETDSIELLDDIRYYLDERFSLRFKDAGIEELMDTTSATTAEKTSDAAPNETMTVASSETIGGNGQGLAFDPSIYEGFKTLDGEMAEDKFDVAEKNYEFLLGKIDELLERLKLDA